MKNKIYKTEYQRTTLNHVIYFFLQNNFQGRIKLNREEI